MAQNADEQAARAQIPALAEGRYRTVSPPGTPLGKGSYGTVVLAFDEQDREYVAIKYLELARLRQYDRLQELAEREIVHHSVLTHPHVRDKQNFLNFC